ncbi:MAG: hypothetical protein COV74_01765 [Candidatus Omnitrophica bacterium CG11_big_fil_rev_8_21_14_0_20_45_26]|uniref:Mechanosensitive ion channel protein MscS n=1 Tax=Candidatus Abzuiibacterium crystallinum TaxID=1974748 RepID=A0A2H0LUC4_9BACT|nr:MAG: hypothetical protein COV74_01765 [Candidatus Omnitrophica bacterium CG11_big_fil_rev_8_21_14_0_20_45_26]PIW65023.1 MAG: hypothetical protein COW12_04045 [Candidatus Omnitrophica bacterium CG12_big_fil_rev_8_21_14_0_65_45_16]
MNDFLMMIETEKSWSWSVIVLAYFILGLLIRNLLLRRTFIKINELSRDTARFVRSEYSSRALLGWIIFVAALIILTLSWMDLPMLNIWLTWGRGQCVAFMLFIFSVLLHQKACTHSLLKFIDDRMSTKGDI